VLRDVSEHQLVDQLQRSRKDIIAAEESIRREIAEMLHGSVQTKLLAAWFRLGEFERQWPLPADAARELSDIRAALDRIREEDVRQASHLLHPSVIRVGLVPAIDYLAAGLSDVLRIDVKADRALRALDRIGEDGLPDELRLVAYRVVEEALNNVAKHSAAGGVAITLDVTDGSLHMAVADDGHGFDPAMVRPGLGFGSIAGRVEHYGGAWQVDSKPGHGAIVEAWLPLNPAPAPTALPIVDSVPPVAALSQV
ncbi:MAG: hypothetical protein JOZ39_01500, partial [Chloroflexi bacterium]|nr:hypothetical protein [Chloroflexota bacterium]